MGAFNASSKAMPHAYNPDRGRRVQQAWQRYSASQRFQGTAARQYAPRVPQVACR
ncbi:hypothetical protein GCM10009577_10130 [Streptomyces javensis]